MPHSFLICSKCENQIKVIAQCISIFHRVGQRTWKMHCGVCCAFNPMNAFGRVIANNLINVYLKRAVLTYFDRYSSCTEDLFDERFSEWTALVSMQRAFELNSVSFWMLFAFSIVSEQAVTHMTRHEFLFTRFFFLHIFFLWKPKAMRQQYWTKSNAVERMLQK